MNIVFFPEPCRGKHAEIVSEIGSDEDFIGRLVGSSSEAFEEEYAGS
jgi:hypothetical protein